MNKPLKGALLAAAAAGFFGAAVTAHAASGVAPLEDSDTPVKCQGINSCKGQSACAGADHSCHGKNECKGKGWVLAPAHECKEKGGTVLE